MLLDKMHFVHDQRINQFISLFSVSSTYLLYQGIFVLLLICPIMFRYRLVSVTAYYHYSFFLFFFFVYAQFIEVLVVAVVVFSRLLYLTLFFLTRRNGK